MLCVLCCAMDGHCPIMASTPETEHAGARTLHRPRYLPGPTPSDVLPRVPRAEPIPPRARSCSSLALFIELIRRGLLRPPRPPPPTPFPRPVSPRPLPLPPPLDALDVDIFPVPAAPEDDDDSCEWCRIKIRFTGDGLDTLPPAHYPTTAVDPSTVPVQVLILAWPFAHLSEHRRHRLRLDGQRTKLLVTLLVAFLGLALLHKLSAVVPHQIRGVFDILKGGRGRGG